MWMCDKRNVFSIEKKSDKKQKKKQKIKWAIIIVHGVMALKKDMIYMFRRSCTEGDYDIVSVFFLPYFSFIFPFCNLSLKNKKFNLTRAQGWPFGYLYTLFLDKLYTGHWFEIDCICLLFKNIICCDFDELLWENKKS